MKWNVIKIIRFYSARILENVARRRVAWISASGLVCLGFLSLNSLLITERQTDLCCCCIKKRPPAVTRVFISPFKKLSSRARILSFLFLTFLILEKCWRVTHGGASRNTDSICLLMFWTHVNGACGSRVPVSPCVDFFFFFGQPRTQILLAPMLLHDYCALLIRHHSE